MNRFNIDLYPQDVFALEEDCRDLSRRAKHLDQWMEVAESLWRQGGDLLPHLGEYLLKALWPDIRRLEFNQPLGREFGGKSNWKHLEAFLRPSNIISLFPIPQARVKHDQLVRLSGWFYSAAIMKEQYRQAIEWLYFGYGQRGEIPFLLMWSDWSFGIPSSVAPEAIAALKFYRGEMIREESIGVETWKEKELKGYPTNHMGRDQWEEALSKSISEGRLKHEGNLLKPSPEAFEWPWWQSISDLAQAGAGSMGFLSHFTD